ncbi:hypothetical protein LTR59_003729 [Friedmanniomyces endolithicus]|nr:hypothetical protein LTR94_011618 [Friedmanniomyces endolithicus]KAK0791919.1 hypothetical protein LTR38_010044 [Friedmanniomyces endolithicus]KAK0806316.1 hypothetical protein LTR59_003729 [Friedmanniomyces endolithicus]
MATRASIDDRKLRPRSTSNEAERPSTAPHSGTPTSGTRHTPSNPLSTTPEHQTTSPSLPSTHQSFVLPDPTALRYLSADPSTTLLTPRTTLSGYETYLVEQWTTSRSHPTSVITTYTGNPAHSIVVGVLSVPVDEKAWNPRLRVYFKALNQYFARRRETELGVLMVTKLPSFPSSLTVIPVPDGDVRKYRTSFFVAENLKRLGCSGRVGLSLTSPTAPTVAKFVQLYRISERIDAEAAVIELVKLCQSALMLFGKLEIDYADGLLCDVTERAVTDWWVEIGSEQYDVEPHDGILGPTTVAGLLGLLLGARNRLHAVGAPVGKDPFDVESMKRGISHFQKTQRFPHPRSRRLDRRTLDRLHKATQKAAHQTSHWPTVPKVLRNTAAELSGKGGEMIVDAVSGRGGRVGIAEVETCEIERFSELVYGARGKWLWRGKAIKKHRGAMSRGGFTWTAKRTGLDPLSAVEERDGFDGLTRTPEEVSDDEEGTKFGVLSAAKSGLGKFKGAVGLKGHQSRLSDEAQARQTSPTTPEDGGAAAGGKRRPMFRRTHSSPLSSPTSPRFGSSVRGLGAVAEQRHRQVGTDLERAKTAENPNQGYQHLFATNSALSRESVDFAPSYMSRETRHESGDAGKLPASEQASSYPSQTVTADPSIAGSIYNGVDMDEVLPTGPETEKDIGNLLRRTLSYYQFMSIQQIEHRSDDAYPRHLSFSLAEESVLTWSSVTAQTNSDDDDDNDAEKDDETDDPFTQLATQTLRAKTSNLLRLNLNTLLTSTSPWTALQLANLETSLLQPADRHIQTLQTQFNTPFSDRVTALHGTMEAVLRQVREELGEGGKEVETLAARLEYEVGELEGRVRDVGVGVGEFGKGVRGVEGRVGELEHEGEGEGEGWLGGLSGGRCVVS